ncbi:HNH endonuclease [Candidatus Palauibacter sp.]|uniref:HNH endonuclease n=1 Tax=Candidatus Palauibacter sp. TaxID=3101350 RepID=UPI003B01CE39
MSWRSQPIHRRRWRRLRLQILDRDGYRCGRCGRAGRLEVDHVTPIGAGGEPWDPANLQALCRGCHVAKTRAENARPDPEREAWRHHLKARSGGGALRHESPSYVNRKKSESDPPEAT